MKKFEFDKKNVQIAILALIVIIFGTIFQEIIGNFNSITSSIGETIEFLMKLVRPFIIAFFIAFFLNPMVRFIEKSKFVQNDNIFKTSKSKRTISIAGTYIFAIFVIYLLIASILPSVVRNVNTLVVSLPDSLNEMKIMLAQYSHKDNNLVTPIIDTLNKVTDQNYDTNNFIASSVKAIGDAIFNIPNFLSSVVFGVVTFANGVIAIILGFVISIYMINDKEYFLLQAKKIVWVLTKESVSERIFRVSKMSNEVLEKFIVGKAIDSFIIGLLFFIICLSFKIPYAPLFAIIIGVTNMIPYFGPFIGAIPVLIITLTWNYKMVIPTTIAILILQQFDGIILGPKILGDSIGLKPISIIFAILVGGGMFGVLGMFLGAPVYAVIATIVNEIINKNYDMKQNN